MVFSMNVMAFVVIMGRVASGQVEVAKDDNIEPFSLLCRIYNVAKNPPINHVDLQEADKIVEEIDALNRSLLEEKRHNEDDDVGNHSEVQVKPTVTREAALAQLSLNQVTQKAHKILEDIKKMNVSKEIGKAKVEFNKVIFGDGGKEDDLCQATVNNMDNRSQACGPPGLTSKGESAGRNLVVDFFCLCATRTESSEGAKQACGFHVGKIDKYYGWSEAGPWGSSTMWASIKGGCGKHMHQRPKSTGEARHILDQFLKHLKTGGVYRWGDASKNTVEGSNRKEGMLGMGVGTKSDSNGNDILCDGKNGGKNGKTPPGGVCVYYGPDSNSWENIDWLKQFKTALTSLDTANNQTATIQHFLQKLQMLLNRAEEIYETAKVIPEIQNTVGLPAALQNATGNLTAHNATRIRSYSHSSRACFIPALVLFL